jgi:hypothetical protein
MASISTVQYGLNKRRGDMLDRLEAFGLVVGFVFIGFMIGLGLSWSVGEEWNDGSSVVRVHTHHGVSELVRR